MNSKLINKIEDFWNARPCNIRHSNMPYGSREYYDEVEIKKYFVEPHILEFAEFNKWHQKDVLEIGCGIGTDSVNFVRNGANLTAVELSERSLNICRDRFNVYNLEGDFYKGNAENLTSFLPQEKQYDLVYSFGVIHHTAHPARIINEIKKVLKPDGELRIMLYAKYSFKLFDFMHNSDTWDFSKADEIIRHFAEAQLGCPQAKTYTFSEVKELLGDYDIIDMKKDHIFPYNIPAYIDGKYVTEEHFKNMKPHDFKQLCQEMGWHLLIKAKLKK